MQKAFIFTLLFIFLTYPPQAFCDKHSKQIQKTVSYMKQSKKMEGIKEQLSLLRYEIEALENGTTEENIYRMNKWIRKLESKVESSFQDAKRRLEKYKNRAHATTVKSEKKLNIEKVRSSENKLQICRELLTILEQLKEKLNKPKKN